MKFGTATNSLVNHLITNSNQLNPEVGMGVTLCSWTDRKAGTIVAIDKNIIYIREDISTRIDENGMSEDQTYEYSPNTNGQMYIFKQDRSGKWREVGKSEKNRWIYTGKMGLKIGSRETYFDFSF